MAKSSIKTAKEKTVEKAAKKTARKTAAKTAGKTLAKTSARTAAETSARTAVKTSAKIAEETSAGTVEEAGKKIQKKLELPDAALGVRSKCEAGTDLDILPKSGAETALKNGWEVSSKTAAKSASVPRKTRSAVSGLTAKQKDQVLAILSVGCSRKRAASFVGGTPALIQKAAAGDEDFALALLQAESQAEITSMKSINAAARQERYWKAAAWILERKNPEEFRLRSPGTFNAEQLAFIVRNLSEIIAEEVRVPSDRKRILARLERFLKDTSGDLELKKGARKSARSKNHAERGLL